MISTRSLILFLILSSCASAPKKIVAKKKPSEIIQERATPKEKVVNSCLKTPPGVKNQSADHWHGVGKCYENKSQHKKAMLYYKLGLSKNNNHPQIIEELAQDQVKKGNYAKAFQMYKGIKGKKSLNSIKQLAILQNYYRHYHESLKSLSSIPKVNEKHSDEVNYLYALNYASLNRFTQAMSFFELLGTKYKMGPTRRTHYLYTLVKVEDFTKVKRIITDRKVASVGNDSEWSKVVAMARTRLQQYEASKSAKKNGQ